MRLGALLFCCGLLTVGTTFAQRKPCPVNTLNVSDARFKPGQVWLYQNRPGSAGSTLTVLRVDESPKIGIIVHVRLDGLDIRNPHGDLVPTIEHMPFTRDAMLLSVLTVVRTEKNLPSLEGLERWQADCGGVYTISVADAITVADKTLNHP